MATRYASITGGVGVPRTFIGGVTGGAGIAESNGLFYTYSFSGPSLGPSVKNIGIWHCPCGSGLIIRKCHMDGVNMLQKAPATLLMHAVEAIEKHLETRQQSATAERE
jgi:hypothetical protein